VKLQGKTAIVTGGAHGIGAAIASALAAEGAAVAVLDLDGLGAARAAEKVAAESGVATVAVQTDISDRQSVVDAVDRVEAELGPVDILVNNAGIDVIGAFVDSDPGAWDRIIAVNLRGPMNTCHVTLPRMVQRGLGSIVNLGSDAGRVGSSGEAVYSATKGGVIAFTKTLAREVARHGIRVNCVCPGPTDTALLGQVEEVSKGLRDALVRAIPMRRIAQPVDIAPVVVFLAGDEAGYVTGQTLSVSGGLTMS
jgi:2-hydroxycyclohexanecarboxyl-CoA dehydrogenase